MIVLITGIPGHGKTLYAVKLIADRLKENQRLRELSDEEREKESEKGNFIREVYTNISGWDHEKNGTKECPDDWRDTPDGSICVYDECQQIFGPDGGGRSKREDIQAMEVHRHTGHDLWLITQGPGLLHANIRALVGRHHHVKRQHGAQMAIIYTAEGCMEKVNSDVVLKRHDRMAWRYDKKLYEMYKSSTQHNHGLKLPRWLIFAAVSLTALVTIAVVGLYYASGLMTFLDEPENETVIIEREDKPQPKEEAPKEVVIATPIIEQPYSGCVIWANGGKCRCWTKSGDVADLSLRSCKIAAETPFTVSIIGEEPRRISRRARDRGV